MVKKLYNTKFVVANMTNLIANNRIFMNVSWPTNNFFWGANC